MPVLSPCEDITSLIQRHAGIQIVGKPSVVRGVLEYHSNCPWCGGHDRFITRPETGWFTCSVRAKGCGKHGDMLDFLEWYCDMTRREACEEIGLDPDDLDWILEDRAQEIFRALIAPPSKEWQDQARAWVHALQVQHALQRTKHAMNFLHMRGLTDKTIQKFDLQYFPLDEWGRWNTDDPKLWGLSPKECEDEVVKLPEGILIPWYGNGQVWKLEVRRLLQIRKNRYMEVDGGQSNTLYNRDAIQPGKPAVVTESAFDAISGEQECGDLAAFVATGGTGKAQHEECVNLLKQTTCVLIAFDDDESGDQGADYWLKNLPHAIRYRSWAHDLNDMLKEKQDIRDWLMRGIERYEAREKAKLLPVPAIASEDNVTQSDELQQELQTEIERLRGLVTRLQQTSIYWVVPYSEFERERVSVDEYCRRIRACLISPRDSARYEWAIEDLNYQIQRFQQALPCDLKIHQRVVTPLGPGKVLTVRYFETLCRTRCSVLLDDWQSDRTKWAAFDASEVQPLEASDEAQAAAV